MMNAIKTVAAGALLAAGSASYATNGDHLIGVGAKSRGMAGVGTAVYHGAESLLINPALIGGIYGGELFASVTLFMPDVATDVGGGMAESDATLSAIPALAVVNSAGAGVSWGIGLFGTAGMGVDYSDTPSNMEMKTTLQLMQLVVPVAYQAGGFSIGAAPVVQYGSLEIDYTGSSTGEPADDFGVGFSVGTRYRYGAWTVGAVYRSAIAMRYRDQLSKAAADFGLAGYGDGLEQPYEAGAGLGYEAGRHTIGFDYKRIGWSDAEGYRDFGWKDQDVFAVGYRYSREQWSARVGVNYAESPIVEAEGTYAGVINTMNLLGFPAIVQTHIAAGVSFDATDALAVDIAFTHAPKVRERYAGMMGDVETTHTQQGLTAGVTYRF